jgi:hypothetical protein
VTRPRTTRGQARPPASPPIPPQPAALREGRCVGHPAAHLWSSPLAAEQETAKLICRACPALDPCRSWSLSLRTTDDLDVILGGLTAGERAQIRRQRGVA